MILLFNHDETTFETNGIGALSDAVSCNVTEERNGMFELEMIYPISGVHYSDIQYRSILFCKPNPYDAPQPFRVYRITRPLDGMVTVYAQHITYDLTGIPVRPFEAHTLEAVFTALVTNSAINNIFTYSTDKDIHMVGDVITHVPYSARFILGGMQGSVLQTFQGEYKFDRFNVALLTNRGSNNGVTLRYGKNLVRLEQDENFCDLYTGVAPYWVGDDRAVVLPETVVFVGGSYDFERILSLDLSDRFETEPTQDQLRSLAQAYIEANNIGLPNASVTIDYAMDTEIQSVHLCDTVSVIYTALGVQATAKVVKTVYDERLNRYKSITLGSIRSNLADTYANQYQNLTKRIRSIEADYATDGEVREIAQEEIRNDTTIIQRAEEIIATAMEEYVRTSDYETFYNYVMTNLSVLAGQINIGFENVDSTISTLSGNMEQQFTHIASFIRLLATISEGGVITQEGGIVLGESSSEIKLKLENDILYFFMGDEAIVQNPIAWFSQNQLHVNNSTIENLTLGHSSAYLDARIVGEGDNICVLWSGRI